MSFAWRWAATSRSLLSRRFLRPCARRCLLRRQSVALAACFWLISFGFAFCHAQRALAWPGATSATARVAAAAAMRMRFFDGMWPCLVAPHLSLTRPAGPHTSGHAGAWLSLVRAPRLGRGGRRFEPARPDWEGDRAPSRRL